MMWGFSNCLSCYLLVIGLVGIRDVIINDGIKIFVLVIICCWFIVMICVFMLILWGNLINVLVRIWFICKCLVSCWFFFVSVRLLCLVIFSVCDSLKLIIFNLYCCSLWIRYLDNWLFSIVDLCKEWLNCIKFVILISFLVLSKIVLFISDIVNCLV